MLQCFLKHSRPCSESTCTLISTLQSYVFSGALMLCNCSLGCPTSVGQDYSITQEALKTNTCEKENVMLKKKNPK